MIKDIYRILIIDNQLTPIYVRENYIQGNENINYGLLTDFVGALQTFAKEYGKDQTKTIELGQEIIYAVRDDLINYQFIMVCNIKNNRKKMIKILNSIKNNFIETFMGNLHSDQKVKDQLMKSFLEGLDKLLEPSPELESLFKRS